LDDASTSILLIASTCVWMNVCVHHHRGVICCVVCDDMYVIRRFEVGSGSSGLVQWFYGTLQKRVAWISGYTSHMSFGDLIGDSSRWELPPPRLEPCQSQTYYFIPVDLTGSKMIFTIVVARRGGCDPHRSPGRFMLHLNECQSTVCKEA
jgi:hypothetical protein